MSEMNCRWNGSGNPRLLRAHLGADCPATCEGCKPCEANHCGLCGRTHVGTELTCPDCLHNVRSDGDAIVDMSARVLTEAIVRGVNSEAANLAGPVADPEAWAWRAAAARQGRADHITLTEDDESTHPAWVLGTWEMLVREHLDQPTDALLSIELAWSYLNLHLTRLANDGDFAFEELARDLRRCRAHMEDVMSEGEREERTQVPCLDCPAVRLVRPSGPSGQFSFHACPRCKRVYSPADFVRAKANHLSSESAQRFVVISEATAAIDRSEYTIRTWVRREIVGALCDIKTHRLLVWWPDVRDQHAERKRRDLERKAC